MSPADEDQIRSGVERRIAAVESLIPAMPAWRPAADQEVRPLRVQVVAGPALREAPAAGRRLAVITAVGAVLLLMLAYGLIGAGREPSLPPSEATPVPTPAVSAEPSEALGSLRPVVEPRITIPVKPATAWTVVEDGSPYLDLAYFLDDVGSTGYSVNLSIFEPRGVYDPIDETRRLPLPDDLIGWIRNHPDLEAEAPVQLTVAGFPATAIDVTVTYRPGGPKGDTVQFIYDGVGSWNLEFPHKKRIVLVELPARPLLIVFGSRPEFFDAGISQFDDELTRIKFDERGPAPDP
jgi:hypothetical protein